MQRYAFLVLVAIFSCSVAAQNDGSSRDRKVVAADKPPQVKRGDLEGNMQLLNLWGERPAAVQRLYAAAYKVLAARRDATFADLAHDEEVQRLCADAGVTGMVGRRPGDRGVRWLKHQAREVPLSAKSWLYGIEKAAPSIRQYRTIILVEGLFDYFAFYNLLQGQDKLVVVSTLGSYLTPNSAAILKNLDIENFIAAYDWDELGRNGIERTAVESGGWVYYLGGLADGQDPYDLLEPVASGISGFSLKHL